MAKAIEETPILEDEDAKRFNEILSNVNFIKLTKIEEEIKVIIKKLPSHLKL